MQTRDDRNAEALQKYYEGMSSARRRIVVPLVIITLAAFFLQQVLTNFTSALDGFAVDGLSWAYVYSFALFFFVVILTTIYTRRMDRADAALRPPHLDEPAEQYDDWREWEHHEAEREDEEEVREDLQKEAPADEIRNQHRKETNP